VSGELPVSRTDSGSTSKNDSLTHLQIIRSKMFCQVSFRLILRLQL